MEKILKSTIILLLIPSVFSIELFSDVETTIPEKIIAGNNESIDIEFFNNDNNRIPFYINITIQSGNNTPNINEGEFYIYECSEISSGSFLCPKIARSGKNELEMIMKTPVNLYPGNYIIYSRLVTATEEKVRYEIIKEKELVYRNVSPPIQVEEIIKEKEIEVPVYKEKLVEKEVKKIDWFWIIVFILLSLLLGFLLDRHMVLDKINKKLGSNNKSSEND